MTNPQNRGTLGVAGGRDELHFAAVKPNTYIEETVPNLYPRGVDRYGIPRYDGAMVSKGTHSRGLTLQEAIKKDRQRVPKSAKADTRKD